MGHCIQRMLWSLLSVDKLVTWQQLSIQRAGHHVVLKSSSFLRSYVHNKNLISLIFHWISVILLGLGRTSYFQNRKNIDSRPNSILF